MEIKELEGKLVAVLGYGQEGKAVTKYLVKHGIFPVLFDQKPWGKWDKDEQEKIKSLNVNFIFGPDCFKELTGFDLVFRSPGIKISQLTINDLQLTSQTKWFFEHCPCKIIGVTGTKGKGTTSSLIYEILKKDYDLKIGDYSEAQKSQISNLKSKIYLTGNIGKEQPLDFLDDLGKDDWVVYELSSFQLQDLERSPHIGVVLMATSEHLDYHKSVEEYREAKTPIVKFQNQNDFAVINGDFEASKSIGEQGSGTKVYFTRQKELKSGCFIKGDDLVVKDVNGSNFSLSTLNFQLKGRHNLENICAATAAAVCAGCNKTSIKEAVENFKGLEHRLEFVAEVGGIKYYNDSFSTTPETAIAAIQAFKEPEILILGGSTKKSDFSELAKTITGSKNIKAIILIGQESGRIKEAIDNAGGYSGQVLSGAKNMQGIFTQINPVAAKGDIVLLSPACASFDMFRNYKDRGEQFKAFVKRLDNYSN